MLMAMVRADLAPAHGWQGVAKRVGNGEPIMLTAL
jgi:hypothetical protein